MKRRVLEQWQAFESKVLSGNCSDVQRLEMRRAFYAGASSIMSSLAGALSSGDEATPDDEQVMVDLAAEIDEFMAGMLVSDTYRGMLVEEPPSELEQMRGELKRERERRLAAEAELRRLGHGQEVIFVIGAEGRPTHTSHVGDAAWDTIENRRRTFKYIEDTSKR